MRLKYIFVSHRVIFADYLFERAISSFSSEKFVVIAVSNQQVGTIFCINLLQAPRRYEVLVSCE